MQKILPLFLVLASAMQAAVTIPASNIQGLGTAATRNVGTASNQVAAGDAPAAAQSAAIAAAATDATTKANAAQAAAISTAAADATAKANAAQAAAATDATTKATAAQAAAISVSATDATTKASSAQAAAIAASQPLRTVAALASDALTLNHDEVIRTVAVTGTKNFTLASAGSAGDSLEIDAAITGTQTITTNFAVYRNFASAPANVSLSFSGKANILLVNMGGGAIYWLDNNYGAADLPAGALANGMTATTQSPLDNSAKLATTAYVDAAVTAGGGGGGAAMVPGTYFGWTTSDLANRPTNSLLADGTNGTANAGTFAAGAATWLVMGNGTVATPTFSPPAGTYEGTQNITISSATPGAAIYYTTNDLDPTTSDTLVTGTVAVAATDTLKAKAFKPLYEGSAVASAAYIITAPPSYVFSDDLVYANNAAGTAAGWTLSSSAAFNYVTSPAPLTGFASSLKTYWGDQASHTFTAQSDVWVYVFCNPSAVTAGGESFVILNGSTKLAQVTFGTASTLTLQAGAGGPQGTSTYTVGQELHLWVHYVKGTGSNAQVSFYRSTNGVRGTAVFSTAAGPGTLDAAVVRLGPTVNQTVIWNKVRISNTAIGDNPL